MYIKDSVFDPISQYSLQDLTSLLAQAVGGGMAATAVGKGKDPTPVSSFDFLHIKDLTSVCPQGGHVMLGGIVFQMGECRKDHWGKFPLLMKIQPSSSYYHGLHTLRFGVFYPVFQR